ncbi:MAG: hypothetical protein LRY63_06515 [Nitrincola sp.]|nr:hypothetical protein [Nitrincola sp.]
MTDPVSDYLGQYSYDQLCEVEKRIESIIQRKQAEQVAAKARISSEPKTTDQATQKATFKIPSSPGYNSTEQLAESLGLDISGLLKEAKAWSR